MVATPLSGPEQHPVFQPGQNEDKPMIELQDVSVSYPNHVTALARVTVCIRQGEFVFIVGPTGAGKSTFLKLLYREEKPTEGRIVVATRDLGKIRPREIPYFRRKIGIVFQDFGLLPNKTVYENVAFALRVIGASRSEIRQRVPNVLEMVSMAHRPDAFPHQLSGGEQQRVAIARALVNDPPLLLADEPTGNLDPETSLGILGLLDDINRRGTTVVVATHDSAIVDRQQRRVLGFDRGQLVRDDARGAYHRAALTAQTEEDIAETGVPALRYAGIPAGVVEARSAPFSDKDREQPTQNPESRIENPAPAAHSAQPLTPDASPSPGSARIQRVKPGSFRQPVGSGTERRGL
jgi:cell division transport system ATP-binding protein